MIGALHRRSMSVEGVRLGALSQRRRLGSALQEASAWGEGDVFSCLPSIWDGPDRLKRRRGPTIFFGDRAVALNLERGAAPKKIVTPIAAKAAAAQAPRSLDPARPAPGAIIVISDKGDDDDAHPAYRGTARRASGHRRSGRTAADRTRVGGGEGTASRPRSRPARGGAGLTKKPSIGGDGADDAPFLPIRVIAAGRDRRDRVVFAVSLLFPRGSDAVEASLPPPFRCPPSRAPTAPGGGCRGCLVDGVPGAKGGRTPTTQRRRDKRGDGACPSCGWFYVLSCAVAAKGPPSLATNYPAISASDAPSPSDLRREARR